MYNTCEEFFDKNNKKNINNISISNSNVIICKFYLC